MLIIIRKTKPQLYIFTLLLPHALCQTRADGGWLMLQVVSLQEQAGGCSGVWNVAAWWGRGRIHKELATGSSTPDWLSTLVLTCIGKESHVAIPILRWLRKCYLSGFCKWKFPEGTEILVSVANVYPVRPNYQGFESSPINSNAKSRLVQ